MVILPSLIFIYAISTVYVLQVVHEEFGIVEGLMTTVHATTGLPLSLSGFLHTIVLVCEFVLMLSDVQQHKRLWMALQ